MIEGYNNQCRAILSSMRKSIVYASNDQEILSRRIKSAEQSLSSLVEWDGEIGRLSRLCLEELKKAEATCDQIYSEITKEIDK